LTILLKKGALCCSIDEIIKHNIKRNFTFATSEQTIENAVAELKTLLVSYGSLFISGDVNAFESALKARGGNTKNYNLKLIEDNAVKAWKNGNYEVVVELYQAIKENLTPIQEKRLHLSIKKIKK
jgi:uncharacterized phage-associated protein